MRVWVDYWFGEVQKDWMLSKGAAVVALVYSPRSIALLETRMVIILKDCVRC